MRRKKGPRVVWLPNEENSVTPDVVIGSVWGQVPNLTLSGAGPITNVERSIILDVPRDPAVESLSDVENSGYRLRRIVGKISVLGDTLDEESGITVIGVTAGFIVRRCDSLGVSLASQVGTNQNVCDPSGLENIMDPWIWRRSWVIINPTLFTQSAGGLDVDPPWCNLNGRSAVDGPHIDQKTARIVGPEERLFLDVSVTALQGADGQSELENETTVFYELRFLGSMLTSAGNRRNASR